MNQIELWMQTPIPTARAAYPGYDPDAPLPPAPEAGEPVLDITDCHPRIAYAASYLHMGVPGALTRCYVRKGVYERLCRALDLLPEAYSCASTTACAPSACSRPSTTTTLPG